MIIFQDILLVFFLIMLFFLIVQFYNIAFRGFAPFIPTRGKVIKKILDELKIAGEATVYELGCGQAGFLRATRKKYPQANLIGVEYSFLPYLIGQIQNSLVGSKIKFIKSNFLKVDLKAADAIYCFLSIQSMADLAKKFQAECKPGTQVVSYCFTLPGYQAEKVLEMENKNKVYFYKI
jgi:hypothetical protein